jgi:hypothetical protein
VSTMAARMKKGSIGEGSVPQYIAMAAAVSSKASSPDRNNGSLGVILLDDASSGLDAEHFVKMLKFISDAGLQIIAAAPDAQSREWAHGMDTFINVSREGNDIYLDIAPSLEARLLLTPATFIGGRGVRDVSRAIPDLIASEIGAISTPGTPFPTAVPAA